ncbi:MAG TPA: hypothetical protein VKP60_22095 [Magnetospirillaceae bacterium]|nr:hypothetical protein [Magnetospirillaceae bacterium]
MKLDFLFSSRDGLSSRRGRQDPRFSAGAAAARGGLPALPDDASEPYSTPLERATRGNYRIDPRNMSPRQLADWAHEMYLCRMLAWEEYCMAGFPPELHPQYNRTIGALTGKLAQPDTPRNMIRVWEERLSFMLRYYEADEPDVQRVEKLLRLLRQQI